MKKERGFTLIELMIVVVIVSILATVAVPAYRDYVRRGHRTEGLNLLMQVAAREEQYYMNNKLYTEDMTELGYSVDGSGNIDSPSQQYKVDTQAETTSCAIDNCFVLQAVPQGDQGNDTCGTLTLSSDGTKTPTTAGCW